MAFQVRHTNSAGRSESQSVLETNVLALVSRIGRLGGKDVTVTSSGGEKWTAEEAAAKFKLSAG